MATSFFCDINGSKTDLYLVVPTAKRLPSNALQQYLLDVSASSTPQVKDRFTEGN